MRAFSIDDDQTYLRKSNLVHGDATAYIDCYTYTKIVIQEFLINVRNDFIRCGGESK